MDLTTFTATVLDHQRAAELARTTQRRQAQRTRAGRRNAWTWPRG